LQQQEYWKPILFLGGIALGFSPVPVLYLMLYYLPEPDGAGIRAMVFGWIATMILVGLLTKRWRGIYIFGLIVGLLFCGLIGFVMIVGMLGAIE
jgi:hypothetical protein